LDFEECNIRYIIGYQLVNKAFQYIIFKPTVLSPLQLVTWPFSAVTLCGPTRPRMSFLTSAALAPIPAKRNLSLLLSNLNKVSLGLCQTLQLHVRHLVDSFIYYIFCSVIQRKTVGPRQHLSNISVSVTEFGCVWSNAELHKISNKRLDDILEDKVVSWHSHILHILIIIRDLLYFICYLSCRTGNYLILTHLHVTGFLLAPTDCKILLLHCFHCLFLYVSEELKEQKTKKKHKR